MSEGLAEFSKDNVVSWRYLHKVLMYLQKSQCSLPDDTCRAIRSTIIEIPATSLQPHQQLSGKKAIVLQPPHYQA